MNEPVSAASAIARLAMMAETLGCPAASVTAYLATRVREHARYTRIEIPDRFDAIRLLTYVRGAPGESLPAALEGVAAAGVSPDVPAAFVGVGERLEADGLYSGIEIPAAGPASLRLLVDASATTSDALDALGRMGVPDAARTAAKAALQPLEGWFRATVGLTAGAGAPVFDLLLKSRFDAPDEVPTIASAVAAAMRNLGIPEMHAGYVEENLGMFTPAGTHDLLVGIRFGADGPAPALQLQFAHLPSNFVLDVLLDFGAPPETGGLIGRMEGILGRAPDDTGAFWVDGLTLLHAGEEPPRASFGWVADEATPGE